MGTVERKIAAFPAGSGKSKSPIDVTIPSKTEGRFNNDDGQQEAEQGWNYQPEMKAPRRH
jgi:hypothetical protein